jgi:hypothetical protein
MARSKRPAPFQPKIFLERLRQTLSTLPSTAEKQEIHEMLTQLMEYLANVQRTFHQPHTGACPRIHTCPDSRAQEACHERGRPGNRKDPAARPGIAFTR